MLHSILRFARTPVIGGGALLLAACSSATPDAPSCAVQVAGDTSESATLPANCGALEMTADAGAGGGGYVLTLAAHTSHLSRLTLSLPLGQEPAPGALSSEAASDWSATAVVSGESACTYVAGSAGVPTGSFSLTLTSVDLARGVAHGTVEATLYVHAPLFTDCGPSNIERVSFAF